MKKHARNLIGLCVLVIGSMNIHASSSYGGTAQRSLSFMSYANQAIPAREVRVSHYHHEPFLTHAIPGEDPDTAATELVMPQSLLQALQSVHTDPDAHTLYRFIVNRANRSGIRHAKARFGMNRIVKSYRHLLVPYGFCALLYTLMMYNTQLGQGTFTDIVFFSTLAASLIHSCAMFGVAAYAYLYTSYYRSIKPRHIDQELVDEAEFTPHIFLKYISLLGTLTPEEQQARYNAYTRAYQKKHQSSAIGYQQV